MIPCEKGHPAWVRHYLCRFLRRRKELGTLARISTSFMRFSSYYINYATVQDVSPTLSPSNAGWIIRKRSRTRDIAIPKWAAEPISQNKSPL
jgi:hypothetical protein